MKFLSLLLILSANMSQKIPATEILLSNGLLLTGKIVRVDSDFVTMNTEEGILKIPRSDIVSPRLKSNKICNQEEIQIQKMDEVARVTLYNARKKSPISAIFYELIGGGGLLYAEKHTLGNLMIFVENSLLIGSAFAIDHPGTQKTILLGVLGLKTINTFWSLYAIHNYNTKIAEDLKVNKEIIKRVNKMKKPDILGFYSSFGVQIWVSEKLLFTPTIRFGISGLGDRIYIEGFYTTANYPYISRYIRLFPGGVSLNYLPKLYHSLYLRLGTGLSFLPFRHDDSLYASYPHAYISHFLGFEYSQGMLNLGIFNVFSHEVVIWDRERDSIQDHIILNCSIDINTLKR